MVIGLCAMHMHVVANVVNSKHASDVRYSRGHNRARVNVGLSVGIGVTVIVVVVFTNNVV